MTNAVTNESAASAQAATTPSPAKPAAAARTRLLLEGPIVATLLRLAAPNVVVNVVLIAVTATVDAHFVGRMGPQALAGLSLVFPLIMLMHQMANSSMGGAIASAMRAPSGRAAMPTPRRWSFTASSSPRRWPPFSPRFCC
jgi:hypothetical protein